MDEPVHGNFYVALVALANRSGIEKSQWKPGVATTKAMQRQVALWVCGWGFRDDDLNRFFFFFRPSASIPRWFKFAGSLVMRDYVWLIRKSSRREEGLSLSCSFPKLG